MPEIASHITIWRENGIWKFRAGNNISSDVLSGEFNVKTYTEALIEIICALRKLEGE